MLLLSVAGSAYERRFTVVENLLNDSVLARQRYAWDTLRRFLRGLGKSLRCVIIIGSHLCLSSVSGPRYLLEQAGAIVFVLMWPRDQALSASLRSLLAAPEAAHGLPTASDDGPL